MFKILTLAKREYKATVRTKGFIIGLAVAPLMMGGSIIAMVLLKDKVDTTDKTLAVLDRSGIVTAALIEAAETRNETEVYDPVTGKKIRPAYIIETITPEEENLNLQLLELSNRIRNKELHAFIEIEPNVLYPGETWEAAEIRYYAENAALDDLRRWADRKINDHLRRKRLSEAGIEPHTVNDLLTWLSVAGMGLVTVDEETGEILEARRSNEAQAVGAPIAVMMLMFIMVMMGAVPLLHSVMEEKNQHIAEVLLGSVKPFEFMAGKVTGGVAVSFTGLIVYVTLGIITLNYFNLADFIPYHILPWLFGYMLLNIIMLGAMLAGLGAICNDAKDAQNLTFPAIMPMMIPMFILVPILKEPLSGFATWMSLFPPFTPMLMLLRQTAPGGVPAWQPIAGLIGILAFTLLSVWAGGRIFRVGILMQGQSPSLINIVRWVFRG